MQARLSRCVRADGLQKTPATIGINRAESEGWTKPAAPFVPVPRRASLGTILSHEPHKRARTRRKFNRTERHTVILLCRPCHKQIHAVFTESELANEYASIDALAAHPKIARFVEWITCQPPTPDIPVRRKRA